MTSNSRQTPYYPVVTICGSMRFYKGMIATAEYLTKRGNIVLMPFVTVKYETDMLHTKEMLDRMHMVKIDMSDGIVVCTNDEHYVGESTRNEILYAKEQRKNVTYENVS